MDTRKSLASTTVYQLSSPKICFKFKVARSVTNRNIHSKQLDEVITLNGVSSSLINFNNNAYGESAKFQIRSIYGTIFGDNGKKVLASSLLTGINMCSSTKTDRDKRSLERQVTKQYIQGTVSTARFVGSNNVLLPPIIVQCAGV